MDPKSPESKWRFADRFGGRGSSVESKTFKYNMEKSKYKKKTERYFI